MGVGPAAGGHDLRRSLPESKDQGKDRIGRGRPSRW